MKTQAVPLLLVLLAFITQTIQTTDTNINEIPIQDITATLPNEETPSITHLQLIKTINDIQHTVFSFLLCFKSPPYFVLAKLAAWTAIQKSPEKYKDIVEHIDTLLYPILIGYTFISNKSLACTTALSNLLYQHPEIIAELYEKSSRDAVLKTNWPRALATSLGCTNIQTALAFLTSMVLSKRFA